MAEPMDLYQDIAWEVHLGSAMASLQDAYDLGEQHGWTVESCVARAQVYATLALAQVMRTEVAWRLAGEDDAIADHL